MNDVRSARTILFRIFITVACAAGAAGLVITVQGYGPAAAVAVAALAVVLMAFVVATAQGWRAAQGRRLMRARDAGVVLASAVPAMFVNALALWSATAYLVVVAVTVALGAACVALRAADDHRTGAVVA